jgi:hypothetical protein
MKLEPVGEVNRARRSTTILVMDKSIGRECHESTRMKASLCSRPFAPRSLISDL